MSEAIEELANELEERASSRANFNQLSGNERRNVARYLIIARSQARNSGNSDLTDAKVQFFYTCGEVGVPFNEARNLWWTVVHNNPAPYDREDLV